MKESSATQLKEELTSNLTSKVQRINDEVLNQCSEFSEDVLGFKNNWHHKILYDLLDSILMQDPKTGLVVINRENKINKRILFLLPREHAKSTCACVNHPVNQLYRNNDIRIVVASASASKSVSFLREQKQHLEMNDELRERFGSLVPKYPDRWASNEVIIKREAIKMKDPSVSTVGTGGAIISKRADELILDDIVDFDNSRTPEGREKVFFWYANAAKPVLTKDGMLVVLGTRWFPGDLYESMMDDPTFDVKIILGALIRDSKLNTGCQEKEAYDVRKIFSDEVIVKYGVDASRKTIWPEIWDYDSLMGEKVSNGSAAFNRAYMNLIISSETQIIKHEWIEAAKEKGKDYVLIPRYVVSTYGFPPVNKRVLGVDLAISEKTTANDTAFAVLGARNDGTRIPLWLEAGKFSPAKTREKIIDLAERYKVHKIKVENVAYQEAMRKDLADYTSLPIEGYQTGGEKFDEYVGINSLGILLENGKWIMPWSRDEHTRKMVDRLQYGMEAFGVETHSDDLLMATWFANQGLRELETGSSQVRRVSGSSFYRGVNVNMDEEE